MNDLSKLTNKKHIIYDFDGTIAKIVIDWTGWHDGTEKIIQKYDPTFKRNGGIYQIQNDMVKLYGKDIRDNIWDFTENYEYANCTGLLPNQDLINYIKNNPQQKHSILSSNGYKILDKLLAGLEIKSLFSQIVARNDVFLLKPDSEGINKIIGNQPKSEFILLGDALSDEQTSQAVGMDFEWIKIEN